MNFPGFLKCSVYYVSTAYLQPVARVMSSVYVPSIRVPSDLAGSTLQLIYNAIVGKVDHKSKGLSWVIPRRQGQEHGKPHRGSTCIHLRCSLYVLFLANSKLGNITV